MEARRRSLALVLAGGGARAAYEVGVLSAIAERAPALEPERAAAPASAPRDYPTLAEVIGMLLHAIFLDALEADAERIDRINQTLARVPAGAAPDGLRPIRLLMLRPSRSLGEIGRASCRG